MNLSPIDLSPMVMRMLKNSPQAKNNPMAQELISILESGDEKAGEEMAMNLCQTYGVSKEDAIKQAQEWANTAFPSMGNN